jgi:hypothetical protein
LFEDTGSTNAFSLPSFEFDMVLDKARAEKEQDVKELRILQQRLQETISLRNRRNSSSSSLWSESSNSELMASMSRMQSKEVPSDVFKVASTGSVSTMAPQDTSDDSTEELQQVTRRRQNGTKIVVPTKEATTQRLPHQRPLPQEYRHGRVPRNVNLAEQYETAKHDQPPTTVMIRNIPNRYTQKDLIQELKSLGFAGTFDFVYSPLDKGTMSNVGYAFVNFTGTDWAHKCMAKFQKYRFRKHNKAAAASFAHIQGLDANLAHYENAAVNNAKLKQRRPMVFANISASMTDSLGEEASAQ